MSTGHFPAGLTQETSMNTMLKTDNENEIKIINNSTIEQDTLTGERAAFMATNSTFINSTFENGESPLKHSSDIKLEGSNFKYKYPLWYSKNIDMKGGTIFEGKGYLYHCCQYEICKATGYRAH